jgi:hypothetical protein
MLLQRTLDSSLEHSTPVFYFPVASGGFFFCGIVSMAAQSLPNNDQYRIAY